MKLTIALFLLARTLSSPGDTLVEVRRGDRLVLKDLGGAVAVESWDRSLVQARADDKDAVAFQLRRSGNSLEVQLESARGREREVDLRITVPAWMAVDISGRDVDVDIRDLEGDVTLRSLQGDLSLRNLAGAVEAFTAEGSIEAEGLTGSARLRAGEDDVRVRNSSAALELETVDGDLRLEGISALRISAKTTDGEIEFSGALLVEGDYGFYTHGGDIRLGLVPPVNMDAVVLAYEGDFESEFPVRAQGFRSGEGLKFRVGTGGARLVVESYDGEVRLVREAR